MVRIVLGSFTETVLAGSDQAIKLRTDLDFAKIR